MQSGRIRACPPARASQPPPVRSCPGVSAGGETAPGPDTEAEAPCQRQTIRAGITRTSAPGRPPVRGDGDPLPEHPPRARPARRCLVDASRGERAELESSAVMMRDLRACPESRRDGSGNHYDGRPPGFPAGGRLACRACPEWSGDGAGSPSRRTVPPVPPAGGPFRFRPSAVRGIAPRPAGPHQRAPRAEPIPPRRPAIPSVQRGAARAHGRRSGPPSRPASDAPGPRAGPLRRTPRSRPGPCDSHLSTPGPYVAVRLR
jgi:hypothetical protein